MYCIQKIQRSLKKKGISVALFSKPENVHYLCNFMGTNGCLLITTKKATLITDFRYFRSARKQLPNNVEIYDQKDGLKKLMGRYKAIGFEDQHLTVAQLRSLKKVLPGVRLKPMSGLVEKLRTNKDQSEIRIMRKACQITDECLTRFIRTIKIGMSEDELEWQLLTIVRKLGGDGFSFPPIIVFGKNTADVHHQKEPNRLRKGENILIDFGIQYKGYNTDITRVFFTRQLSFKQKKIYETVLEANQKAIAAIKVGRKLSKIDQVARDVINQAGFGDHFGHSTGHGVGLEIHESPTVSEKSTEVIQPGMIFTIEPGIYLDNIGGVRIEDMVYVNEKGGVEVLSKFDKKIFILNL